MEEPADVVPVTPASEEDESPDVDDSTDEPAVEGPVTTANKVAEDESPDLDDNPTDDPAVEGPVTTASVGSPDVDDDPTDEPAVVEPVTTAKEVEDEASPFVVDESTVEPSVVEAVTTVPAEEDEEETSRKPPTAPDAVGTPGLEAAPPSFSFSTPLPARRMLFSSKSLFD